MAKTLAQTRAAVRAKAGDTAAVVWTDNTELDDYINEGQQELAVRANLLWRRSTPSGMKDVAATATYALPTDTFQVERCTWRSLSLLALVPTDLMDSNPSWETEQGEVWGYVIEGDGASVLRKVKVPAVTEAVAGNFVLEDYYLPATLTLDADTLALPDWMWRAVQHWALYRMFDREGKGHNPDAAAHYRGRFEQVVVRVQARKAEFLAKRIGRMGDSGGMSIGKPAPPRLPWNFGTRVRR